MDTFSSIEVEISVRDNKYEATSATFPHCMGVGDNEEEAIKKLSDAIAQRISGIAKTALKEILLSDRYSEVIIDTTKKHKKQKRIFSLDPMLASLNKTFYIKMNQTNMQNAGTKQMNQDINSLLLPHSAEFLHNQAFPKNEIEPAASINKIISQNNDGQDGIIFGFPLSFN